MARLKGTLINRRIIWSAGFGKKRRLIFQDTGETGKRLSLQQHEHSLICLQTFMAASVVFHAICFKKCWKRDQRFDWGLIQRSNEERSRGPVWSVVPSLAVETRVLFLSLPVFCLRTLSSVFSFNLFYFSWLDTDSSLKLHDSCWLSNRSRKQCFLMK